MAIRGRGLLWIALSSFLLLLAVRFGGRTYPGWYIPDSTTLNALLNGNALFTRLGYDAVLIAAAAGMGRILPPATSPRRLATALKRLQWAAPALTLLIVCYGVAWAVHMQRLTWQEDGRGVQDL